MADAWVTPSSIHSHSGENASYPATNLIDENTATRWRHFVTQVHWVILDMGENYSIKKLRQHHTLNQSKVAGTIYVSEDTENWGDAVGTFPAYYGEATNWYEYDTTDKTGRYIKLETGTESDINWREWDIYGSTGEDVTVTPSVIALMGSLKVPSLLYDYTITPLALTLTGVLKAPTIITGVDITVSPDAITIIATLKSPSISGDAIISPSVLALIGTVKSPSVLLDCIISVLALALTGILKAPTIVLAADVTITPDAIVLTLVILDSRVGMFDGIYEEEQRVDTAYIELTKPSTIYTEFW